VRAAAYVERLSRLSERPSAAEQEQARRETKLPPPPRPGHQRITDI
jgi:hypothetical protein